MRNDIENESASRDDATRSSDGRYVHMPRQGEEIAERLLRVASFVLQVGPTLRKNGAPAKIVTQLQSAGTSGGANYEEARGAASRRDFIHKTRIALKEVRETRYWLRLVVRARFLEPTGDVVETIDELEQLVAILTASCRTAAANLRAEQRK